MDARVVRDDDDDIEGGRASGGLCHVTNSVLEDETLVCFVKRPPFYDGACGQTCSSIRTVERNFFTSSKPPAMTKMVTVQTTYYSLGNK